MQLEKPRPAGLFAFQGLRRGAWVVRAVAVPKWPAYRYDLLPLWSARHELPIAFATEYPWSFLLSLLRSRLPLPISISLLPVVVIRVVLVLWLISGAVRDCKGCGRASVGKVRTPDLSLRRAGGDVDDGLDEAGRAGQGRAGQSLAAPLAGVASRAIQGLFVALQEAQGWQSWLPSYAAVWGGSRRRGGGCIFSRARKNRPKPVFPLRPIRDRPLGIGAQEKTRTSTVLPPLGPEPSASTNSATWACSATSDRFPSSLRISGLKNRLAPAFRRPICKSIDYNEWCPGEDSNFHGVATART